MGSMSEPGKLLLLPGGAIALLGLLLVVAWRVLFLGRLAADLTWRRGNASCSVPLASSILLSLLLTLVLNLVPRALRRQGPLTPAPPAPPAPFPQTDGRGGSQSHNGSAFVPELSQIGRTKGARCSSHECDVTSG